MKKLLRITIILGFFPAILLAPVGLDKRPVSAGGAITDDKPAKEGGPPTARENAK